jgi:hypothetical protein
VSTMDEFEQLKGFMIAANENTSKLSLLNERIKAVQIDPNQSVKAGLKEYERRLTQTKVFTDWIDSVIPEYCAVD